MPSDDGEAGVTLLGEDARAGQVGVLAQHGRPQRLMIALLAFGALLPPIYVLIMVQYGAITFPYWDELDFARQIVHYLDGTLTFHEMIEAQAQARPLFPRLIVIANAALTRWDIRSEFTFVYLTVYGALVVLVWGLWRQFVERPSAVWVAAALVMSIISCSPVGAQDQYWSLMLLATLCCFLTIVAFVSLSFAPRSWPVNIMAAALGWISSFSISQGLFIFPTALLLHQLISPRRFVPTRWSWFWLINLAACYLLYLPGMAPGDRPRLVDFLLFIPVYVGNPLGSLLWFPMSGAIDLPETAIINGVCGLLLLAAAALTARRAFRDLASRHPDARLFFCFALFAAACTLVTAFGRANGDYAIASANSSRYSVFAAFLLFGLVFYHSPRLIHCSNTARRWHWALLTVFVLASVVSYERAIPVYSAAHDLNERLAPVFAARVQPSDVDLRAYPDASYLRPIRADLRRLGIGPYRSLPELVTPIYDGGFVAAIPLSSGAVVTQSFTVPPTPVRSISFQIVDWAKVPSDYLVQWRIVTRESRRLLGEGVLSSRGLVDWRTLTIGLADSPNGQDVELTFAVSANQKIENPIGLVLYPPGADRSHPAVIDGQPRGDGSLVGLSVHYFE